MYAGGISFTNYNENQNTYQYTYRQSMGEKVDTQERHSSHSLVRSPNDI